MLGSVLGMLLSTLGSILMSLAAPVVIKKLILLGASKLVKSTKTTFDDELFKIVSEAVEKAEIKK